MFTQFWPRSAGAMLRSTQRQYLLAIVLGAGTLLAQGCAPIPPQPFVGTEASNPDVRVPPVAYRPVLGTYSRQRPVEPSPWRERNDRVAPTQKKEGQ